MIAQLSRAEHRARLEAALPRIVEQLAAIGAKKIVLFGSLVRGDVARSSDIDLIVVLDLPGRFMDRLTRVYEALDVDVGVDALVYTSQELAELSASRPFLQRALREGRLLYAPDHRAEGERWLSQSERDLRRARPQPRRGHTKPIRVITVEQLLEESREE